MDVHLIPWPSQEERRLELMQTQLPRLLMVEPDADAPIVADVMEDWIRLPAPQNDVRARVITLRTRWREKDEAKAPAVSADGVLRCGSMSAVLPPIEQRLMKVLLDRFGVVVGRDALLKAGWPGQMPERNVLDVHMGRLRKRIEPVDLVVKTVRSRGYMLESRPYSSSLV